MQDTVSDGRGDFDFLLGAWTVRNHKLRNPLDPACTLWDEFESTSTVEPILGGLGNVERVWAEGTADVPAFEGFTLRLFNPATRRWSIWWSSTRQPGLLDDPMLGSFTDGTGIFLDETLLGGAPAVVRFTWTSRPNAPRWEQEFSWDAGATFISNWTWDLSPR